eukprot:m.339302 g.339302  ORF g.339302 m.339302 type:complete len:604 (+) comp19816_c0_seq22:128-1939(+)
MADASDRTPLLSSSSSVQEHAASVLPTFAKQAQSLSWHDVSQVITMNSSTQKTILTSCAGKVSPGELSCIMGPSGSGKSSLLNALAGRTSHLLEPGAGICLDGRPVTADQFREHIAYVQQEDSLLDTATVRESIFFSAQLRLPPEMPLSEKKRLTEEMIRQLRLERCADTIVGSTLLRGVSGGEKKRVSIGVELVTRPRVVLLDEPTTGLDSFAAWTTVQLLQDIARTGCSVLAVIHQPSSEVYALFDKTMLLGTEGRIVFAGATTDVPAYFASQGLPCPSHHNPADHALLVLQTESEEKITEMHMSWRKAIEVASPLQRTPSEGPMSRKSAVNGAGFVTQLSLLTKREFNDVIRNKGALVGRFGMTIFLNLLVALIFKGVGTMTGLGGAAAHFGGLTQIAIGLMFGSAQPMLLTFPLQRPVFLREYATSHYGVIPYFVSKVLLELPLTFITACLVWVVSYWLMELRGNFIYLVLVSWMLGLVASSTALMLGSALPNVKVAMELAPAIFVPQLLFAGFFVQTELIPVWLRWAQWGCSLKFALNLFMIIEFEHCIPEQEAICLSYLHGNSVRSDQWWLYVTVLIVLFVLFRALALIALRWRALK